MQRKIPRNVEVDLRKNLLLLSSSELLLEMTRSVAEELQERLKPER
jgi:hypothetical protein